MRACAEFADLVLRHHAAVTDDVRGDDRREPPSHALQIILGGLSDLGRNADGRPGARGALQRRLGTVGVERPAEEPALRILAAERQQHIALLLGFDPLGHRVQADFPGQADHALQQRRGHARRDRAGEAAIDLELVERETAEIAERGIAGAEIVHRQADAVKLERHQCVAGAIRIGRQRGLG